MCLHFDEDDLTHVSIGTRRARKPHRCVECRRTIDPGEEYHFNTVVDRLYGRWETWKMCAHCRATIRLGSALTGCPETWVYEAVFAQDVDDYGFVADVIEHHDLSRTDRFRMLRTYVSARHQWRLSDGTLMPVPTPPRVVVGINHGEDGV